RERRHGEEDKRSMRWPAKQATSSGPQTADERRKASTASSFVHGLPCPNRRCATPRRTPLWLCGSVAKRSSSGLRVFGSSWLPSSVVPPRAFTLPRALLSSLRVLRRRAAPARAAIAFSHPIQDLDEAEVDLPYFHIDADDLH